MVDWCSTQYGTQPTPPCPTAHLLYRQQTPQYERLNIVEKPVHRLHAVKSHQVQFQLSDAPFAAEFLVIALRAFLRQ